MASAMEDTSAMDDSLPSPPAPPPSAPITDSAAPHPPHPPHPPLHRQRTVFIQRLRLEETEQRPCTSILQRIDGLHRRSLEGSTSHLPSVPSASSRSQSGSEEFEDAGEWKMETEGGEEDDEGEDGDGVLVASPSVHLHDCVFAVNDAQTKLALSYGRHLYIHALLDRTDAASSSSSSQTSRTAPRYRDDIGEVNLDQRVQFAQSSPGSDAMDSSPFPASSVSLDDDDAALHAKLLSDRSPITALCWYRCEERDWLLVGNSSGLFRCYHSSGRLVFAHTFHASTIRQIKPFYTQRSQLSASLSDFSDSYLPLDDSKGTHPAGAAFSSSSSSTARPRHRVDVLVVHDDSLCVIEGKSIRTFLRVDLQAQSSLFSTTRRESLLLSLQQLKDGVWRHDKWRLLDHGVVEDAVRCERIAPVTIDELLAPPSSSFTSSDSPYFLVTGADPSLAYYSPSSQPFTLAAAVSAAGQLGGMVAAAVKEKVFGFAKSWWAKEPAKPAPAHSPLPSSFPSQHTAVPAARKKVKRSLPTPQTAPLVDLPLTRAFRDSPRVVLSIRLDPLCGHYAVCTDSLGRVSLLETDHLLITRLWKGYREAKTAWMVLANDPGQAKAEHPPGEEEEVGAERSRRNSQPDHLVFQLSSSSPSSAAAPLTLFLLLYAPRRGLLELWAVPHGKRVGALNIGYGCVLLQPQLCTPLGGSTDSTPPRSFPHVDVLNPAGQIRRVVITADPQQTHSTAPSTTADKSDTVVSAG